MSPVLFEEGLFRFKAASSLYTGATKHEHAGCFHGMVPRLMLYHWGFAVDQCSRLARIIFVSLAVLPWGLASYPLFAQTSPTRMLACESKTDSCRQANAQLDMVWTFNGTDGTATSPSNPAGSPITIEKFDSGSIVVRRVDATGLTALYAGTVKGAHITGTVQWSWPGHPDYPAGGSFSAVLRDQLAASTTAPAASTASPAAATAGPLPDELLVCENGNCNAAWIFQGSEGSGTWFTRNTTKGNLTVLRSEPDYIVIARTDTTDGVSARYTGSPHGDHWSGTIVWSTPGRPGEATGSWTATIPQTTCDPRAALEAPDALRIGQNALMFHRDSEALGCYIVAANDGDATAQTAVGLIYYQGRPAVPQDYKQAFYWLHKAADQGVYAAQRTVAEMYKAGQGTARDATLSGIYTARADEQKHDKERQEDRQMEREERAADRSAQVLSSFVLGASFGMFLF